LYKIKKTFQNNIGDIMLIIVGSRREGNSLNLAKMIKNELEQMRVICDIIVPGNQRIHLCTGCMDCDKNGVCDFTDDMKKNIEKFRKEEVICFITPTRWNLLSGDLKIMMDRLNPMYRNKELKNKKMIAIAIGCKGREVYSTEAAINSLISFAENAGMEVVLTNEFNHCLNSDDIKNKTYEVDKLISEIKNIVN